MNRLASASRCRRNRRQASCPGVTRRFGPELCRRLDQALGHASEPIEPLRPSELVEVRRSFAEPIAAAETIARYISKLVVRLCAALEERGLGAKRLDLLCWRVDAHVQTVRVGLARPQRDPHRLALGDVRLEPAALPEQLLPTMRERAPDHPRLGDERRLEVPAFERHRHGAKIRLFRCGVRLVPSQRSPRPSRHAPSVAS